MCSGFLGNFVNQTGKLICMRMRKPKSPVSKNSKITFFVCCFSQVSLKNPWTFHIQFGMRILLSMWLWNEFGRYWPESFIHLLIFVCLQSPRKSVDTWNGWYTCTAFGKEYDFSDFSLKNIIIIYFRITCEWLSGSFLIDIFDFQPSVTIRVDGLLNNVLDPVLLYTIYICVDSCELSTLSFQKK